MSGCVLNDLCEDTWSFYRWHLCDILFMAKTHICGFRGWFRMWGNGLMKFILLFKYTLCSVWGEFYITSSAENFLWYPFEIGLIRFKSQFRHVQDKHIELLNNTKENFLDSRSITRNRATSTKITQENEIFQIFPEGRNSTFASLGY